MLQEHAETRIKSDTDSTMCDVVMWSWLAHLGSWATPYWAQPYSAPLSILGPCIRENADHKFNMISCVTQWRAKHSAQPALLDSTTTSPRGPALHTKATHPEVNLSSSNLTAEGTCSTIQLQCTC